MNNGATGCKYNAIKKKKNENNKAKFFNFLFLNILYNSKFNNIKKDMNDKDKDIKRE